MYIVFIDSCTVKNGGCDCNAICSHDPTTFEVKCTCKTGYTNTGSGSDVNCTGKLSMSGYLLTINHFIHTISSSASR